MDKSEQSHVYRKQAVTSSRDLHRNMAQEEEAEPRSRTLAEEEHLDRSHMVELGHTHMQLVGVDRHLVEDTVHLVGPENLAATGVPARTLAPVVDWGGKLAVRVNFAAETVGPAEDSNQTLAVVKAVAMDVVTGD